MTNISNLSGIKTINKIIIPIEKLKLLSEGLFNKYEKIWDNLNFIELTFEYKEKIIKGYIVEPKIGKNLPCITYNRGGIGSFGKIENKNIFFILAEMASWGYVIVATEYGEYDEYGGEDIQFIKKFQQILLEYNKIDSSKIGLYGASRGGMMNYLLLQTPTFAKCAVIKAGVSNQVRGYELRPELIEIDSQYYNVNSSQEIDKRSSIKWVDKISKNVPILLIHGTHDTQVSPLDSLEIATAFYRQNIPFSLYMLYGDNHRITNNKELVNNETKKWFDTYLK
jgi:dipeptidyl aminopeptidase/acylaminoacyl peptidase